MLNKLGNKNTALLGKMLDLHAARHKVIAGNVANVNTPHYRRRAFNFEQSLQHALDKGTATAYRGIEGQISRPNNTPVRNNGNNVDIDKEMLDLKENQSFYQIYSSLYNRRAEMTKAAIRGGR